MIGIVLALVLFLACCFVVARGILYFRTISLTGLIPLTLAGFIGLESVVLNMLSIFGAVGFDGILYSHLVFIFVGLCFAVLIKGGRQRRYLWRLTGCVKQFRYCSPLVILLPLLVLTGLSAIKFAPNNYDSLSYHMTRVVHWLQQGSIGYYPTINERQNVMGPGAEYVILFFQALTRSDLLAPLVQWSCFLALVPGLIYLNRIIKIPKSWRAYVVLLAASTPIAVMQASNTKNDLVAALMMVAMLVASSRAVFGNGTRVSTVDFVLLGMTASVGYLVKPTALLAVGPIVLFGGIRYGLWLLKNRQQAGRVLRNTMLLLAIFSIIAGPDIYRKSIHNAGRHEVYPLVSEYTIDRLWNPVRVFAHNTPFPDFTAHVLKKIGYSGEIITKDVFHLHEDMIGNPYQALAVFTLGGITLLCAVAAVWTRSFRHAALLSFSPLLAWLAFGFVVKDQGWITRLEIPLFFLLPFSFVLLARLCRRSKRLLLLIGLPLSVMAIVSVSYAFLVACRVPARPLIPHYFWGEKQGRVQSYYNNAHLQQVHDGFLKQAQLRQCRRVGLVMGPDSAEYPLVWRAYLSGIETRHLRNTVMDDGAVRYERVPGADRWPCMVYADDGVIEHVPDQGSRWLPVGDSHTFYRNEEWEFAQSSKVLLRIDAQQGADRLVMHHDMHMDVEGGKMLLVAESGDPQMLLPAFSGEDISVAILELDVTSPADTLVQVFFRRHGEQQFSENSSFTRRLVKGPNRIYCALYPSEITGVVRLDIGTRPGEYGLSSIEVRGVEEPGDEQTR